MENPEVSLMSDTLGGFFCKENLNTELKEFCLKVFIDLYLSLPETEDIFENRIWNDKIEEPIKESLTVYFNKVLPKYISSAFNSKIMLDFILGVDDKGEITGIPFKGDITKEYVEEIVKKSIKENISINNSDTSLYPIENYVMNNIEIQVDKLNIDENLLSDDYNILYNEYKESYLKNNDIDDKYKKVWFSWLMNLSKYSTKLKEILNTTETRIELIDYIQNKNIAKNTNIDAIISELKEKKYIPIPNFDELQIRKIDKSDIMYWLVTFKDEMTHKVCQQKPVKPPKLRTYSPFQIISKLSVMRKLFIKNSDINYFLIKIKIAGNNYNCEEDVYYLSNSKWIKKIRKVREDGEPYSE